MDILERIKKRLDLTYDQEPLINDFILAATDRIKLRLGLINQGDILPSVFNSIVVEIVIKAFNRMNYEGITTESIQGINTSFVDDLLREYEDEFSKYNESKEKEKRVVRFL